MRRVLTWPVLILQGGAAGALTLAAAPPAHADPLPPGGVTVCIDGEVEVHVGDAPGDCPRPPSPKPPTSTPPAPEPEPPAAPEPTPPPDPTPEPPPEPTQAPPPAGPPAAVPAPRPPAPRPAAITPPARPAPPRALPRPAPAPSPSPREEVVHHTVQRASDERPERRDPLSTSLVLVVIAVVVSAGTAIAFAR